MLGDSKRTSTKQFLFLESKLCMNHEPTKSYLELLAKYTFLRHMNKLNVSNNPSYQYYTTHLSIIHEESLAAKQGTLLLQTPQEYRLKTSRWLVLSSKMLCFLVLVTWISSIYLIILHVNIKCIFYLLFVRTTLLKIKLNSSAPNARGVPLN